MTRTRHPCGCASTEREWLDMCAAHRAEYDETHARWAREHDAQQSRGTSSSDSGVQLLTAGPAVAAGHL